MTESTPPSEDQEQVTQTEAPAVDSGTSPESEAQFEAPFNIHDVPEEVRPHVERYQRQLQGAYTKKTQSLAEQRAQFDQAQQAAQYMAALHSDPDVQRQEFQRLAQSLGYEIEEPEEAYVDPTDHLNQRLSAVEQTFEQAQAAQQEQQYLASLAQDADQRLGQMGIDDPQAREWIKRTAAAGYELTDDGTLDVDAAYAEFRAMEEHLVKEYVKSKRSPQAPGGVQGQVKPDLSTPEGRVRHAASVVEAQMQD